MKEQYNHQGDTEMIAICMFIIFFLYLLWLLTMSFSLWPIFAIIGAILFVGISVELHYGTLFRVIIIAALSLSLFYVAAQFKMKTKGLIISQIKNDVDEVGDFYKISYTTNISIQSVVGASIILDKVN